MGVYSNRGSRELDARIDADMAVISARVSQSRFVRRFRGIVLMGGYGRGEGTPFLRDGREEPFNDYDLIVVSDNVMPWTARRIRHDLARMERELTQTCGLPVDLCLYTAERVAEAEFSLLNYELKYGHRVIWGDPAVLDPMPAFRHDRIPLSEGTRLLMNRGALLLDVRDRLRREPHPGASERLWLIKYLFKAFLAFGDCALLMTGEYDLYYHRKVEKIARLAGHPSLPDADYMIDGYQRAVAYKQWADPTRLADIDTAAELAHCLEYFPHFFRWYEAQRLKAPVDETTEYAQVLKCESPVCGKLKAGVLNLVTFRARALSPSPDWFWTHPRLRLFSALPLLLTPTPDTGTAAELLNVPGGDGAHVERRFVELQQRFA